MTRPLSPRQREVMNLLLAGLTAKRIARALHIEYGTVRVHAHELYQRLGVHSRDELVARYTEPTDEARRLMENGA